MISICIIFTVLATATQAKGAIECNFSELIGDGQCFGEEGQMLLFHLPNIANEEITVKKDNKFLILRVKNQKVTVINNNFTESQDEAEVFTSGKLILGKTAKKHSGKYVLQNFGSNGTLLKSFVVDLDIQDPVSEPAVSQMCVSPEKMKVTCSSKGDGIQFSWKFVSYLLLPTGDQSLSPTNWTTYAPPPAERAATQEKPRDSEMTIILHGQLTGSLMCIARNKVSRQKIVTELVSCKDYLSFPLVLTVAVIVGVVLLLVPLILCVGTN